MKHKLCAIYLARVSGYMKLESVVQNHFMGAVRRAEGRKLACHWRGRICRVIVGGFDSRKSSLSCSLTLEEKRNLPEMQFGFLIDITNAVVSLNLRLQQNLPTWCVDVKGTQSRSETCILKMGSLTIQRKQNFTSKSLSHWISYRLLACFMRYEGWNKPDAFMFLSYQVTAQ